MRKNLRWITVVLQRGSRRDLAFFALQHRVNCACCLCVCGRITDNTWIVAAMCDPSVLAVLPQFIVDEAEKSLIRMPQTSLPPDDETPVNGHIFRRRSIPQPTANSSTVTAERGAVTTAACRRRRQVLLQPPLGEDIPQMPERDSVLASQVRHLPRTVVDGTEVSDNSGYFMQC